MTLTFDDWFDLYRHHILTRWPKPWPDQVLRQAHLDLQNHDPATVEAAIAQHVTAGSAFPPNGPQLVRACNELARHTPREPTLEAGDQAYNPDRWKATHDGMTPAQWARHLAQQGAE